MDEDWDEFDGSSGRGAFKLPLYDIVGDNTSAVIESIDSSRGSAESSTLGCLSFEDNGST